MGIILPRRKSKNAEDFLSASASDAANSFVIGILYYSFADLLIRLVILYTLAPAMG